MPTIKKDNYSRKRFISVIRFTFLLGNVISFFINVSLLGFGIYALSTETINKAWMIPLILIAAIGIIAHITMLFIEKEKIYYIKEGEKSIWKNEKKWLIFFLFTLNLMLIFLGYIAIQRKIYNMLV